MNSQSLSAFRLLESQSLPSLSSTGSWYRHVSGLEVLCIQNHDRENMFAAGFSTLPWNSTGVPHIIEHTVLSGSENYPLRDPFIGLIQSSLATFINAMTYSDRTLFPVCSCNHQDLFNLIRVYWDSVFHPLLLKQSFQQEGWHYELRKQHDGPEQLFCNGIVLNEMKGAYSDLDAIYERSIYRHLLPDTPLANDSGGNPDSIIDLSYGQFLDFYKKHYALDNAKILFYGDLPLEEKLAFLSSLLENEKASGGEFPAISIRESNPLQKAWPEPREATEYFPSDFAGGSEEPGSAFALAWNLGTVPDPVEGLGILLLDFILFGNDGSVMNKTLLESGLCTALLSCGCDDDYQETIFQIGVRGVRPDQFGAVESLILQTLEGLKTGGIPQEVIRTAFRQLQLDQYEIDSDHCINIMEDVFATWNYGKCSPFTFLQRDSQFQELDRRLKTDSTYMVRLLDRLLLQNPHLLKLRLLPDSEFLRKRDDREAEKMARTLASLSDKDKDNIRRELKDLRRQQKQNDRPEDLEKLPRLNRSDLNRQACRLPAEEIILNQQFPLQKGKIFTNGINYLKLAFDLSGMPDRLYAALPFFVRFFNKTGAGDTGYSEMADLMASRAMSLKLTVDTGYTASASKTGRGLLILSMKALAECFPDALDILDRQWTGKIFRESKRLQELLRQHWSQLRDEILQNGQYLATSRAALGLTRFAVLNEELHGSRHVQASRKASDYSAGELADFQALMNDLALWFSRQIPFTASYSGEDSGLPHLETWLAGRRLIAGSCSDFLFSADCGYGTLPVYGRREIIPLNNGGACCARIYPAPRICDPSSAGMAVYAQLLSCGYLWEKIRMQGGAYGVNCQYHPFNGLLSFLSSEDPHPLQSFQVFSSVPDMDFKNIWTSRDIDSAVIACSKGDDRPWRPGQVTSAALMNKIYGFTEEMRQERRDALLSLKSGDLFRYIDEFWETSRSRCNDCLVGSAYWGRHSDLQNVPLN